MQELVGHGVSATKRIVKALALNAPLNPVLAPADAIERRPSCIPRPDLSVCMKTREPTVLHEALLLGAISRGCSLPFRKTLVENLTRHF